MSTTPPTPLSDAGSSCEVCEALPAPSTARAVLAVQNLVVGYGATAILPPVSFTMRAGEIWALFGPNGGGKSTLLRTLLGLQPALSGQVDAYDAPIAAVAQRQELDPLVPARTIDVVRTGCDRGRSFLRPWMRKSEHDAVDRAVRDTAIEALLRQPFRELSEGQKQRVLIARALASEPTLLTLDEPTSAMDPFHEEAVFRLLEDVAQQRDLAVLVASHHMHILTECAANAVYVDREFQIVVSGPFHEVAAHPAVMARYGDLMTMRPCHNLIETRRLDADAVSAVPAPTLSRT